MQTREYYPNENPNKMAYVEDAIGIIFENYDHSNELTYSSGLNKNYKKYKQWL
ncbi:MAG: hypothetical protein GW823_01890 [Bacteroidetes bacterium]|nr:hypothetical protein [Bacteroidota bacterium]